MMICLLDILVIYTSNIPFIVLLGIATSNYYRGEQHTTHVATNTVVNNYRKV